MKGDSLILILPAERNRSNRPNARGSSSSAIRIIDIPVVCP